MSYPAKLMNLSALLAKLEATYGTAIAVTATTDGQLLALSDRFPGLLQMAYAFDGKLGPAPGNLAALRQAPALGRTVSGDIPMRFKGASATYSSTVFPSLHTMWRIAGFDAAFAAGVATYTPTADSITYGSATMEMYKRGEKWTSIGTLANWAFAFDGPAPPIHTFSVKGIASTAVADAAMVAPTYPNLTIFEPAAAGITASIGSWTVVGLRSGSFNMNRNIDTARIDLTAADAHLGFVPNGYDPELKLVVEQTALATTPFHLSTGFDPYRLRDSANNFAVSLQIGSAAQNKMVLSFAQAQLSDFTLNNDGPVATAELTLKPYGSTPVANDVLQILCA